MKKSVVEAPVNAFTKKEYTGINAQDLNKTALAKEYKSNQWATYKAWFNAGYQVQKGEHGVSICVVYHNDIKDKDEVFYTRLFNKEQVLSIAPEVN